MTETSARLATEANRANIEAALNMLRRSPDDWEKLAAALPDEALRQPLEAGEWSPRRVLAHLVNCEARTAEGICHALLLDNPPLQRIHAERDWGKLMRYERYAFAELLAYFRFRRRALLAVLESLRQEEWLRTVQPVGKKGAENVYLLVRGAAIHETRHIQQLAATLGIAL